MTQKEKENRDKLFKEFMERTRPGENHPHEYDFKYLMEQYYQYYLSQETYNDLLNHWKKRKQDWEPDDFDSIGDDPIKLWYLYKHLDQDYKPERNRFDCDSWNQTCDLTDNIYDILWRDAPWFVSGIRENFGGDTMNSFAYTFHALANKRNDADSFQSYIEHQNQGDETFKVLNEYAKWTGCIGNFTLVPQGFNAYRGMSSMLLDYWDLSLHDLRFNKDGQDWLNNVNMTFHEYINTFFLWDYVDDNAHVCPLFPSHEALLSPRRDWILPRVYAQQFVDEFQIFTEKVNNRICRRGQFMVAMLQIAKQDPDSYFAITKTLSTERCLGTMETVVERLINLRNENAICSEAAKILEGLKFPSLK